MWKQQNLKEEAVRRVSEAEEKISELGHGVVSVSFC